LDIYKKLLYYIKLYSMDVLCEKYATDKCSVLFFVNKKNYTEDRLNDAAL